MHTVLKLHKNDNVIVALQNLKAGEVINYEGIDYEIQHDIEAKHKFVTEDIAIGEHVTMYGVLVGKAIQPIKRGAQITTFNLKHESEQYSVEKRQPAAPWTPLNVDAWKDKTFNGYHRTDGSVGTRNYWLVVPLVFCENRNIMIMKDAFERELGYAQPEIYRNQVRELLSAYNSGDAAAFDAIKLGDPNSENIKISPSHIFSNVDGIKFLTHETGCGGTNQDTDALCDLFAGMIVNPNVAGVTVLSLGCQKSQIDYLKKAILERCPSFDRPILYFDQQTYGTEHAMMSDAIRETFKGIVEMNKQTRKPAPISKLTIGLKCGGSDGFSGISANPAIGHLSDIMVSLGGTTLLAEFPELCGVEQELINRCVDEAKAQKFADLMKEYSDQAAAVGATFDMNPSVGNIKDGLITDAIKSAGAAKKGGNAPVAGVLNYTEQPTHAGLHLLCTPGNDVLATTGMAASSATLILFTTGLGTPTGNPVTPTVKISTNNKLAEKMPDIIDFSCGKIITGEETIEQNAESLLNWLIGLANGDYLTKAELLGQDDFIPWRRGVNL
ncbi:D-galactarate dehydratase/Altronate hydrolase domain protein [Emticicia oligotrophica DSM 17448]|uniref:D-galactarate dehydratase/Altronate hydrolase domain protein n=1 Tax=Emticicia oligotrophica (strain DSM 17448 / CIP 109782 / MTCC 6937 / GPTSA100-15) TaxID=929562 RepID=A0ABN4ALJ9_EMTOG|nr:altronate dehydratase family protein [Emticicia oligotrophica]AFK02916.1 D-galactarate dehydratase/Altronate hydrolase domain protein [Emticicia oligotrophica DSM 17448]